MPRIITHLYEGMEVHEVLEGSSINDFMISKYPELKNFPVPVVALEGDTPILRKEWNDPLEGSAEITIVCTPKPPLGGGGGGGSNPLPIIGTILGLAIMWWNPAGWAFALGSAVIAAGMIGGMLSGQMMQPVSGVNQTAVENEESSPTYSLNASTNRPRLLQVVPEGFGRMQIVPDVVAQPYTVYLGENDQYLFQVFGCGRGEYEHHELSFADVVFWKDGDYVPSAYGGTGSDNSIQIEIVAPGEKVTIFPDNVETSPSIAGQQLYGPNEEDYSIIGPVPVCPPGTTTNLIQIDIIFPQGVGRVNKEGKLKGYTVGWLFEYQEIDDNGEAIGDWISASAGSLSLATRTAQRKSLMISVDDRRYQVRGMRTTNHEDDGRSFDMMQWEALRAYLPGTLRYDQTVIAVRMRATNTLSKAASERFKVLQTRKLPEWNPHTHKWTAPIPTRSFGAAVAWVCKADWGGRLPDNMIDLDGLWEVDRKVVDEDWTFDAWIDSAYSVASLLYAMCGPFRTFPRLSGSKLTFAFDEPGRPVRHVFTPHDIVRGSFKPTWNTFSEDSPDDVIISYLDEDHGYATLEVQATLPDSESRTPKFIQLPMGIVRRKQAHDYGLHLAATNRYRRIGLEFQIEKMGRIISIGDVVAVSHPRLRRAASGRVKDWNRANLMLELDSTFATEETALYMTLTDPYGRPWGPVGLAKFGNCFAIFDKDDFDLVLSQGQSNPFDWMSSGINKQPTVWTLQTSKQISERFLVQKITPDSDGKHSIVLVNDDPRVYEVDVPVPPWEYRLSSSFAPALGIPTYINVEVDPLTFVFTVSWLPVLGASSYIVEQYYSSAWTYIGTVDQSRIVFTFDVPGAIYIRVRAVDAEGVNGPNGLWTGLLNEDGTISEDDDNPKEDEGEDTPVAIEESGNDTV